MKLGDDKKRERGPLELEDLKNNYSVLQKKYNLPSFNELNEAFSIEKIDGTETDFLMREVRRMVSETVSNYLTIIENLLNPSNAPMFVFSIVKCIGPDEKKKLSELYMILAREWAPLLQLDLKYSEEKEAEFVKHAYQLWKDTTKDFYEITEIINKNWDTHIDSKNSGYFG